MNQIDYLTKTFNVTLPDRLVEFYKNKEDETLSASNGADLGYSAPSEVLPLDASLDALKALVDSVGADLFSDCADISDTLIPLCYVNNDQPLAVSIMDDDCPVLVFNEDNYMFSQLTSSLDEFISDHTVPRSYKPLGTKIKTVCQEAQALMAEKKYDEVVELFAPYSEYRSAPVFETTFRTWGPYMWNTLGIALNALSRELEAKSAFQTAFALGNYGGGINLADMLIAEGDFDQAKEISLGLMESWRNNNCKTFAHYIYIKAAVHSGDAEEALVHAKLVQKRYASDKPDVVSGVREKLQSAFEEQEQDINSILTALGNSN